MKPTNEGWTTFLTNLANLLKVKTLITLPIILAFCFFTAEGIIEGKDFLIIASAVVTYYFTKDTGKGENNERKDS